jgi:NAD+ kinase
MQSGKPIKRVAVITHNHAEVVNDAVSRLERLAGSMDIEVASEDDGLDLAVTLGGDGSMLRAFHRFLDKGVPVIGVNFGRVGFLTSIEADELEQGLERVFGGDFTVVELPALDVQIGGESWPAVNDVFATSSKLGRMVELGYAVGGEDLGVLPCDGVICSTPSGSTAYNLSNGGPVLVPHDRPLTVTNRTRDGAVTVIVDGMEVGRLEPGQQIDVHLGDHRSLLATLPERTFFSRYRETFAS